MEPRIAAAIITADRKAYSVVDCLAMVDKTEYITDIYMNIQTSDFHSPIWFDLKQHLPTSKPFYHDVWDISGNWGKQDAEFDQDNEFRLSHICMARNRAIHFALRGNYDYLLFVDSDVVIDPDGFSHLLALNLPLCGGLVPGRGSHDHLNYIFGEKKRIDTPFGHQIVWCEWGTCGYMLIKRSVFSRIAFRFGAHPDNDNGQIVLSEDPAYCTDTRKFITNEYFVVHTGATASHVDNPDKPLTIFETLDYREHLERSRRR